MKKLFLTLTLVIASLTIVSCSDDDKHDDIRINYSEVPVEARTFIEKHFSGLDESQVAYAKRDNDGTYDVVFKNGIEMEFYNDGDWKEIDMNGNLLPQSIAIYLPTNALSYISTQYSGIAIEEIEKVGLQSPTQGFKIELRGDIDVYFDAKGNVVKDKGNTNGGNQVVPIDQLPESIATFLNKYFEGQTPQIKLEWNKYEITYNDNTANEVEVEFLKDETFKSIEAKESDVIIRTVIRDLSPNILIYIEKQYQGFQIEEFSKTPAYLTGKLEGGYKVELEQGKTEYDVYFDKDGNFVKTEID